MKKVVAAIFILLLLVAGAAYAQDRGTAAEAKALLGDAVAFYKANGQDKAFAAFNDPKANP